MEPGHCDMWRLKCRRWRYPTGTLFIGNRELADRTASIVTHAAYSGGDPQAFRGLLYGIAKLGSPTTGEQYALEQASQRMTSCLQTIRQFARNPLLDDAVTQEIELLRDGLRRVRNTHKRQAYKNAINAQTPRDRRRRRNPGKRLVSGVAANEHIQKRLSQLPRVSAALDQRVFLLGAVIDDGMARYRTLREDLKPADPSKRNRLRNWLDAVRTSTEARRHTVAMLRGLESLMVENLFRQPFHRNTKYTLRDLRQAIRAATHGDAIALNRCYVRMQHAAQWMFIWRVVHDAILRIGIAEAEGREPSSVMLRGDLSRIQKMVDASDDTGFAESVKGPFQHQLDAVRTHVADGAWKTAKVHLKQMERLL